MYPSYNEHNTLKMHLFEVPTLKKKSIWLSLLAREEETGEFEDHQMKQTSSWIVDKIIGFKEHCLYKKNDN